MYERFEQLLHEKGLTPYRVYIETGVSQGSLSDWKHGKSKPKYTNMLKLANFLGVSVEYLNGDSDKKEKPGAGEGEGLTDQDRELLDVYNRLSPENRSLVEQLAKRLADNNSKPITK